MPSLDADAHDLAVALEMAARLAADLAGRGVVVVSGLFGLMVVPGRNFLPGEPAETYRCSLVDNLRCRRDRGRRQRPDAGVGPERIDVPGKCRSRHRASPTAARRVSRTSRPGAGRAVAAALRGGAAPGTLERQPVVDVGDAGDAGENC